MGAMTPIIGIRQVCSAFGLLAAVGTKAFVPPLRAVLVARAHVCRSSLECSRRLSPGSSHRARLAGWSLRDCYSLPKSTLSAAEQSVDSGVQLPPAESVDEYATFLAKAIRTHLDDDWMEQSCHENIGDEVAKLFREAVAKGTVDLSTLVMDIGTGLEKIDMGDAFVGPWDIANLASDFLMGKMGAEVSGCSITAPLVSTAGDDDSGSSRTFRFTQADVERVKSDLTSEFSRYRFLKNFMNEDLDWTDVNIIMAVYQGYTPVDGGVATDVGVRNVWRRTFPGPQPPDLETAEGVMEALELDYPDLPDVVEGLNVLVETVYGGEVTRIEAGNPDTGVPANKGFLLRSTICKWLYMMGFLNDDIKRAPDDVQTISDLATGRVQLKSM